MVGASGYGVVSHMVEVWSWYSLVPVAQASTRCSRSPGTRCDLDFHAAVQMVHMHRVLSMIHCCSWSHEIRGDPVAWLPRAALSTTAAVCRDRR